MATFNTEDLLTIQQLADELKVGEPRARAILDEIPPSLTISRTRLWDRNDVRAYVYGLNEDLMKFLGARPPHESYDVNIATAEAASEGEV